MATPKKKADTGRHRLPRLHDIEKCRELYECEITGDEHRTTVARRLGVPVDTASRWIRNPDRFSPYPDEVALTRARFEREVYDNLSNYELHIFWARALKEIRAEEFNGNVAKQSKMAYIDLLGMSKSAADVFFNMTIPGSLLARGAA